MYSTVKKKLNSRRGASMILVMALFLVCVMVSSIILAAASAGLSRNAQRNEQQNGYLAISSATDLIIGQMEQLGAYVGKSIEGKYGCEDCTVSGYINHNGDTISGMRLDAAFTANPLDKDYVSNPYDDGHLLIPISHDPYVELKKDEENTTLNGSLEGLFERGCTQVFVLKDSYSETFTMNLSIPDERLPEVICHFTMDESYNVRFELTTAEQDYAVSISCFSDIKISDESEYIDTTDKHKIYYKKFDESTGRYFSMEEEWAIPVEVKTTSTEISWGGPMVEKEVLSQ